MANVVKTYECPKCGDIEILQLHTEESSKCPTCNSEIERVLTAPMLAKDSAPRTVGTMMEKNNRNKYSREKSMGEATEAKLSKESHMRKLANASPAQTKKYIETGIL